MSQLTQIEIDEITTLHNRWLSNRGIAKLKKHSPKTVKKYIAEYYEEVVRLSNEINREKFPVRVFFINIFLAWLFLIAIIWLAIFGIYTLINF